MSYEQKYLKYKQKYLGLKKQIGGEWIWEDATDFGCTCNDSELSDLVNKIERPIGYRRRFTRDLDLKGWRTENMTVDGKKFNIIRYLFNEEKSTKPNLVVMAGISFASFCGSAEVIVQNIESLRRKFKGVYIINLQSYKDFHGKQCGERDKKIISSGKTIVEQIPRSEKIFFEIHKPEINFSEQVAIVVNNLISNPLYLGLTDVHLLGKCAGAGVAIEILSLSPIYKALYLAVPGIPNHVVPLLKVPTDRLREINIIIGWNENDIYPFKWGKSIDEKVYYDAKIKEIEATKGVIIKYTPYIFSPGNGHEINPDLVEIIGAS